jgi:hypothetical protein
MSSSPLQEKAPDSVEETAPLSVFNFSSIDTISPLTTDIRTETDTPTITTAISSQEKESFMHISGEKRNNNQRAYSTTSSVYAEHTLSSPDNDQVIYW